MRNTLFFEKLLFYSGVKLLLAMDDQISSTTPSYGFQHDDEEEHRADKHVNSLQDEAADFSLREAVAVPEVDEILDLAGGAKDALERHRSTLPRTGEPLLDFAEPEPSSISKPEPEPVKPALTSASGDATTKPTKSEEKEEKTTVTPSKSKSSCSCKYIMYLDLIFNQASKYYH